MTIFEKLAKISEIDIRNYYDSYPCPEGIKPEVYVQKTYKDVVNGIYEHIANFVNDMTVDEIIVSLMCSKDAMLLLLDAIRFDRELVNAIIEYDYRCVLIAMMRQGFHKAISDVPRFQEVLLQFVID